MSPRTLEQNAEIRKESKQKIMDAALRLLAKNGYESTSIAMIAKEAEVSKGLLYNYFESKEDLLKELVYSITNISEEYNESFDSEDPKETLKILIEWFFNEIKAKADHWRLLTELTIKIERFDFVHKIVIAQMQSYIKQLEAIMTQLGYKDPLGEARLIAALFDGIGMHALIARDEYALDEMEQFLLNKYCK